MKIKEYTLEITSEDQTIDDMPARAKVLTVQLQYNKIVLFVVDVDEDGNTNPHTFALRTIDDEIGTQDNYIGTVQTHLVKTTYHIYQVYTHQR